jgi:hypothetical protein
VDHHTTFHKYIAYTMAVQVAGHVAGWVATFSKLINDPASPEDLTESLSGDHVFTESLTWATVASSIPFVTGVIALVSFVAMGLTSRR